MSLYELIHDILVRPPLNNLWCTNYSSVRTNTRFTVIEVESIAECSLWTIGHFTQRSSEKPLF